YNPATLGRNKGVSFTPIDPGFGLTNLYSDQARLKNFPKNNAPAIASRIMDLPIYLQASAFPTLKMGQFGFTLFLNNKTSMVLRNATHPMLDVNYSYDRGFITGFAFNVFGSGAYSSKGKRGTKSQTSVGQRVSIGAAVKHMNRQGLSDQFDLFGTSLLNTINSGKSDITALKNALGYSTGSGWGYDLGVEYAYSSGRSLFTAGYSLLDIGGTRFTVTQGTKSIPVQKMMANAGMGFKQDFGLFDYTLSADMHPILGPVDFARQFHFGSEFSFPLISVLAGWNEGYLSYGATVKFWPVKITTGFYGVEVGSHYREQEAKRFVVYLSLFDFSIDI
ncbi:MAG: hypothetical protein ACXVCE_15005, partial [Bacteriovorax sp.]